MRVDPSVSRKKFDIEVGRLIQQRDMLLRWRMVFTEAVYPNIQVICMAGQPLRLLAPLFPGGVPPKPGTPHQLLQIDVPSLGSRPFGIRLGLDDYDVRPISIAFCDPFTWAPLDYNTMFRANLVDPKGVAMNVLLGDHPSTKSPFLCVRGTREYHEHPQHTGDEWELYRGSLGVIDLLQVIFRTCVEDALPYLTLAGQVQVQWFPRGGPA